MSTFQQWTVEQITNLTNAYNTLVDLKKNINQLDEKTTYETGMYIAVYDPTQNPPKTIKFPFIETALGYATEAYVNNQILNLIDSAPSNLNTLNEIAAAINDDPNFNTTITNLLALKLNLTGGTLTGTLNGTAANFTGSLNIGENTGTGEKHLTVGNGRTGNGYSYIDLVGDATYTDYGLRIIRGNSGANTDSSIIHRGTGNLIVQSTDAGNVVLATNNTTALTIDSSQDATFSGNVKSSGTILSETNNVQTITGTTSSATIGANINVVVVESTVNCTLTIATTTNVASIKVINATIASNNVSVSFLAGTGVTISKNILDGALLTSEFAGILTKIATNNWIASY